MRPFAATLVSLAAVRQIGQVGEHHQEHHQCS